MSKVLAIDWGMKYIGLAISDEGEKFASTLPPIVSGRRKQQLSSIQQLVEHLGVRLIIIGLPLGLQEKPTKTAILVKNFVEELRGGSDVNVITWNETSTSQLAAKGNRNIGGQQLHSEAARIMLQEYLDFQNTKI